MNTKQPGKATPAFDKAEMDLLKEGLKRSYAERFHVMTKLMRRGKMFMNAKITHSTAQIKK